MNARFEFFKSKIYILRLWPTYNYLFLTGEDPETLSPIISSNKRDCRRDDIAKFKFRYDGRIVFRKDLCLSYKSLFTLKMFVFTKCNENSTIFYQFTDKAEGKKAESVRSRKVEKKTFILHKTLPASIRRQVVTTSFWRENDFLIKF